MSNEDGAIVVDVYESTGLVEEERCEGDAKLCGNYSQATLLPLVFRVEFSNLFSTFLVIGLFHHLFVHQWHMPVLELLIEMSDLMWLVEIDFPELLNWHA